MLPAASQLTVVVIAQQDLSLLTCLVVQAMAAAVPLVPAPLNHLLWLCCCWALAAAAAITVAAAAVNQYPQKQRQQQQQGSQMLLPGRLPGQPPRG